MKRPKIVVVEDECPACKGTGFAAVKQRFKPGRKIYPPPCKKCAGKGRLTKAAERGVLPS